MSGVSTDFELAAKLADTLHWIAGRTTGSSPHIERLQRAIAFCQGLRTSNNRVEPLAILDLRRTDPFVATLWSMAEREGYERARRDLGHEEPASIGIHGIDWAGIGLALPPGELQAIDRDGQIVGRITGLEVPCGSDDFMRPLGARP